jgi:hypothetical protein
VLQFLPEMKENPGVKSKMKIARYFYRSPARWISEM